jgi:sugar porter (SP) family MFS transporter
LSYWQDFFNHPKGSTLGLFNCIGSVGALFALIFLPFTQDWVGRKPTMVFGGLVLLVGVGLQAGARDFQMFVAARFIIGFGTAYVVGTAPLLIAEVSPAQDRAVLVTLSGACYQTGAFIAAWTTYATLQIQSNWSWRLPSLLQAIFTVVLLCALPFIPESPRYYIAKDKHQKALEILAYYHAQGDETDEVVQLEFIEIVTALAMERAAEHSSSYLDFFRTKGNLHRLLIVVCLGLFAQWSGNGLVSYYLTTILKNVGITSPQAQLGYNGGLTTFSLITNIYFSFFVDKWGRRPIQLIASAGMLVAFTIWTIIAARYAISPETGEGKGVLAMIFLYYFWYNLKSGMMSSYSTEILPYNLRAKGFNLLNVSQDAVLFFNQYVNSIALNNIGWKYYIFYCCFLALEVTIIYFFFVETRYMPLEEISKIFDGNDVAEATKQELLERGEKTFAVHVEETEVEEQQA